MVLLTTEIVKVGKNFESVFAWHTDITKDQIRLGNIQHLYCFISVKGFNYLTG